MENTIVLPKGAIIATTVTDRFLVSMLKGLSLNLASLLRETLYQLHDGITIELWARESRTIQVLSEQKISIEQLSLECDELVSQNQQLVQVIEDSCRSVPELAIPTDIPVEVRIHKLVAGVYKAMEEMTKV